MTQTPWLTGIGVLIDISALASGPHTVQFRIRNANGVQTDSPARGRMTFTKP
jgi:hypothetical protein